MSALGSRTVYSARAGGCKTCQFSGYKGRTGIHELLNIDDTVRKKIMQKADASRIRAAATQLETLRADGAGKVLAGITSFEEIIRVTQVDA